MARHAGHPRGAVVRRLLPRRRPPSRLVPVEEVAPIEPGGLDVVIDDRAGGVAQLAAGAQHPPGELGVLAGKRRPAHMAEVLPEAPEALEHLPSIGAVGAERRGIERDGLVAVLEIHDGSVHPVGAVIGEPARRRPAPDRHHRPARPVTVEALHHVDQPREPRRSQLDIVVGEGEHGALGRLDAGVECVRLARLALVPVAERHGAARGCLADDRCRVVGGLVVHHHDLPGPAFETGLGGEPRQHLPEGRRPVVGADDDRNIHQVPRCLRRTGSSKRSRTGGSGQAAARLEPSVLPR